MASLTDRVLTATSSVDPYALYEELLGPPQHDPAGGWLLTRHADVTAALASPALGVAAAGPSVAACDLDDDPLRWFTSRSARWCDGALHGTRRLMILDVLGRLAPAHLRADARHETRTRLEERSGPEIDVMAELARSVPMTVTAARLGFEPHTVREVADAGIALAAALNLWASPEQVERGRASTGFLHGAVAKLVRENGGEDSADTVAALMAVLFQTCDATAGTIGNATRALVRDGLLGTGNFPGPDYLVETIRHDPATHNTRRHVHRPVPIGGTDLRPGDQVLVHIAAANRDPASWPEPARFDPSRGPDRVLTFGSGLRPCPGLRQAEALAMGVVETVASRCRASRPIDPASFEHYPNLRIPASIRLQVQ
jgi:cytochrome P450